MPASEQIVLVAIAESGYLGMTSAPCNCNYCGFAACLQFRYQRNLAGRLYSSIKLITTMYFAQRTDADFSKLTILIRCTNSTSSLET